MIDTAADIHFATPFLQDVPVLSFFKEIIKPSDLVKKPFEITVPEVYTSVVITPLKFISKAAPRIHTTDFFVTCPNIPLIRDTAIIPKKRANNYEKLAKEEKLDIFNKGQSVYQSPHLMNHYMNQSCFKTKQKAISI